MLLLTVSGDTFFYFISLLAVLVINTLGLQQIGLSKSATSLLSVSLMVGVCVVAFGASKLTGDKRWTYVLAPGALGMGICMAASGLLVQMIACVPFWLLLISQTSNLPIAGFRLQMNETFNLGGIQSSFTQYPFIIDADGQFDFVEVFE